MADDRQGDNCGFVRTVRAEDLAEGQGRTVEAGGQWLALFRVEGEVYAIDNACPHMAGPLGAGPLDGTVVTCPLHRWRIDVRTGCSPTNEYVRVARYETRVEDGWIWVQTGRRELEAP